MNPYPRSPLKNLIVPVIAIGRNSCPVVAHRRPPRHGGRAETRPSSDATADGGHHWSSSWRGRLPEDFNLLEHFPAKRPPFKTATKKASSLAGPLSVPENRVRSPRACEMSGPQLEA